MVQKNKQIYQIKICLISVLINVVLTVSLNSQEFQGYHGKENLTLEHIEKQIRAFLKKRENKLGHCLF